MKEIEVPAPRFAPTDWVMVKPDSKRKHSGTPAVVLYSVFVPAETSNWFSKGTEAFVPHFEYSLYFLYHEQQGFYSGDDLTLILRNHPSKLEEYVTRNYADEIRCGDLDWVFSPENIPSIKARVRRGSVRALGKCIGIDPYAQIVQFGSVSSVENSYISIQALVGLAMPFIERSDKQGWLDFCKAEAKNVAKWKSGE